MHSPYHKPAPAHAISAPFYRQSLDIRGFWLLPNGRISVTITTSFYASRQKFHFTILAARSGAAKHAKFRQRRPTGGLFMAYAGPFPYANAGTAVAIDVKNTSFTGNVS